ncbi:hypothetical protein SEA_SPOOKY_48 [Gordonia phage Spooky]|nr:hypothetical protein SEA_SPOOKY_48 [Gordonia phage Spooky]
MSIEYICEGCGAQAGIAGQFADDPDEAAREFDEQLRFEEEWDDRHRNCVPTIHEVVVACDSGCGREVTHHGVAAADTNEAAQIARDRMAGEGWAEADGFHCRACMLKRSGWQSQPGPNEVGHGMSVEAIPARSIVRALTAQFVDHSDARRCGCGERTDGAQASAAGDAAEAPNFPRRHGGRAQPNENRGRGFNFQQQPKPE